VLFLNLGDSYYGGGGAHKDHHANPGLSKSATRNGVPRCIGKSVAYNDGPNRQLTPGLKPKNLCGIPWRVALALQADDWWLRSDIIWSKPNPMPESCTDRPTKAHEYIFLLTKSAHYFWDGWAVREDFADKRMGNPGAYKWTYGEMGLQQKGGLHNGDGKVKGWNLDGAKTGRNLRTVWEIATQPLHTIKFMKNGILEKYDHFASFPSELVRRCVAAGTSERGCCPKCGAPGKRVMEKEIKRHEKWYGEKKDAQGARHDRGAAGNGYNEVVGVTIIGWTPTCTCDDSGPLLVNAAISGTELFDKMEERFLAKRPLEPIPCTVLDPFSGSGTTALVAAKLDRDAIGIELNPEYVEMSRKRIAGELGMLAEIKVEIPGEIAV
jgi:hypothetical protein